jgi:hypothetical protein
VHLEEGSLGVVILGQVTLVVTQKLQVLAMVLVAAAAVVVVVVVTKPKLNSIVMLAAALRAVA